MLSPQEHFRIISETASDAIVTIDEQSTILFANQAASHMFGYADADLIGSPLTMLMPERMHAAHHAGIARHLRTGERRLEWSSIELPGLHKSGRELMLEVSFGDYQQDDRHYYTGIMRDITERLQMRRRLDAEQDVLRILAAATDTEAALKDVLATVALRFNWVLGAMWVAGPDADVLTPLTIWQAPDLQAPGFIESTRSLRLRSGEGLPGRVWASGQPTWVRDLNEESNFPRLNIARAEGIRSAVAFAVRHSGTVLGVIEFFATQPLDPDPSLLAMMDTLGAIIGQSVENRRTMEALQKANRVKSEFLATMSHELRTPLNAMIGYSQLLVEGIPEPLPPHAHEKVSRIGASARHLLGLIEEILSFTRLEAGEESLRIDTVQPSAIGMEVTHLVEPLAIEKGLHFEFNVSGNLGSMVTDPMKLRQILVNLLGNAIKFTEKGSIALRLHSENGNVHFDVCDTGPGIPDTDLEQIFEPFWQAESGTTRRAGGTGLGLSVTRRLVTLLGGEVRVRSNLGAGTTFSVILPRRAALGGAG